MSVIQQVLLGGISGIGAMGIDSFSTVVTGLHSLKRKWTGYAGACIRIRRSSDSTEQDIGFTSPAIDASVDTTAATTFCGAGDGFITTIYDQSGLGNSWVQATAAKQSQGVLAGAWVGNLFFDGVNDSMASVNNSGTVSVYSVCSIFGKRSWGIGTDCMFFERGTNLGGVAENGNAMTYAAATASPWRGWKSAGVGNYAFNGVATGSDPVRPALNHATWVEMDYAQAVNTNSIRLFVDAAQMPSTGNATTGTVGIGTTGSALKWFLAGRNNTSLFADINWVADILVEGFVSDSDKATMQAILER